MATISTRNTSPHLGRPLWLQPRYLLPLLVLGVLVVYLIGIRPRLMPTMATEPVETTVVGLLALSLGIAVLALLGTLLIAIAIVIWTHTWTRMRPWFGRLRRELIVVVTLV